MIACKACTTLSAVGGGGGSIFEMSVSKMGGVVGGVDAQGIGCLGSIFNRILNERI